MGSRKEDERNEKIIRGLMKLPPNRRCINCNCLGPQYVCTNFQTFVCMTCSGIHREFTHRVKSVSMAKFTSQEVDALQNGGNQRAREIYLKNWDFQRQRLPDSSNVETIREFIRNVYVDRRYAAAKSCDKPPRDSLRIHEDDTRRASSYHSYSQSPPYDYQYEDRRYGKQAAALTRKPGSDKVRYEGKINNIIFSPGRLSDHAYDDRFANEGSRPRRSDFSVSNGGEQFKSDVQHSGTCSSEDVWSHSHATDMSLETNSKTDANGIHCPQRTTSSGSTDSNLSSLRSYGSGGLVDFFSEPFQASGPHQNKVSCAPQSSDLRSTVSSDLSGAAVAPKQFSSSDSPIDLFQLPAAPAHASLVDLFRSSALPAIPSFNECQTVKTSQPSSADFFVDLSQLPSAATSIEKSLELSVPKNEGWAIFDTPQHTTSTAKVQIHTAVNSTADSLQERFDPFFNLHSNILLPSSEAPSISVLSSVTSNLQNDGTSNGEEQVSVTATNTQPWNAFKDSATSVPVDGLIQELQMHGLPSTDNQFLDLRASEGSYKGGLQGIAPVPGFDHEFSSHFVSGSPYPPSSFPLMGEVQPNEINHKSINPFDCPYDSDEEHNNTCALQFLDVSSLQASLLHSQLPPAFHSGIAEPWLPPNTLKPNVSSAGQGGLTFIDAPPPNSQILSIQSNGPVASVGGNPFA